MSKEDIEARLDEVLKKLGEHTDAINDLTREQYELMNQLRTRFGM